MNAANIFGEDVFTEKVMKERLSEETYRKFHHTIDEGKPLDSDTAEEIAAEMCKWAVERGATHYTHWFQPLSGATAEKHDAFISAPDRDGTVRMEFSGKGLIKGETDASSFPSGGLRATFEARGYTVWDCTSPAFVRHDAAGATLCIPTAFCSYTGEALDQKTPLLRSMQALNEQSLRLIRLLGNTTSKKVTPCVGAEQEYFLVDKDLFLKRKDLVYAGRTLFGMMPPKGQEMDDHYFGSIRERVGAYMKDVNTELWKLGVPAKTQHNEAAPAQHELVPIFAPCNVAVDHNQLIMEVLKKVGDRHNLTCLLHEKPFAGVNGSGKHNNWSLLTDDGMNLLDPGKTPHDNLQFLMILACVLRAVDRHAALLRESAADPGNDQRLGGLEAPPAIISIYLGEQLEDVLDQLMNSGQATYSIRGGNLMTDVKMIPDLYQDATDRNRTAPFAFTGNKFEFRMPGSCDSVAPANVVLNTIVAESFADACDELEAAEDKEARAQSLICRYVGEHSRILFNGNGYSKDWLKEAKRRGLPILNSMVESIPALTSEQTVKTFGRFGVLTRSELESRAEIRYENYAKIKHIEAKTMLDLSGKSIFPIVAHYTGRLARIVLDLREAGIDATVQELLLKEANEAFFDAKAAHIRLQEVDRQANEMHRQGKSHKELAEYVYHNICPAMDALRTPIDMLEGMVDKQLWPMPSYGDLIFEI